MTTQPSPEKSFLDHGGLECQPTGCNFLTCNSIRGRMSALGLGCAKTFRSSPKLASDWLASTLKRADWLSLRSRDLETLLKLPEVILSDLETPRQPAAQARIAARSGFTPTMSITRVRL